MSSNGGAVSLVKVLDREGVVELQLDRPQKRNAISNAVADELLDKLSEATAGGHKVVILSAHGAVFCAGADLSERDGDPEQRASMRLLRGLLATQAFVIAEVSKPVFGTGVAMVACCPLAFCSPDASFTLPEARLGVFAGPIAQYLESMLTPRLLMDMALGRRSISASEAATYGLVSEVVPQEALHKRVKEAAEYLNKNVSIVDDARAYWHARVMQTSSAR